MLRTAFLALFVGLLVAGCEAKKPPKGNPPSVVQSGGNPAVAAVPHVPKDKVAFTVKRAHSNTRSAVSHIRFEQTLTDIGYGWNPYTNTFETYYSGVYVFTFGALSTSSKQFRLSLIFNGQESAHAWGNYQGYQSASNTVVLPLKYGDRVHVELSEGSIHELGSSSRGYTTFTGFKL